MRGWQVCGLTGSVFEPDPLFYEFERNGASLSLTAAEACTITCRHLKVVLLQDLESIPKVLRFWSRLWWLGGSIIANVALQQHATRAAAACGICERVNGLERNPAV